MKFTKRYREFVKEQGKELPVIQLKKLKVVLKNCEINHLLVQDTNNEPLFDLQSDCPVCDGSFFPSLMSDMYGVANFFNKHAKKLLESHLASGFHKYVLLMKNKLQGISHPNLIKQANDLVTYAIVNSVAIDKMLKKYDKVHCSMKGQRFKQEAQTKQLELLKSPWLFELMAFHINLRDTKDETQTSPNLFDCLLHVDHADSRPSILVTLFNSITLNLDLMCPICLETAFDPISLSCSHIFCYMCACSVASVTIVDGLKVADPKTKCPICRQVGVFGSVVHLDELSMLLSRSLPEYWKERLQRERRERIKQAKEHWEFQCRAFMGYKWVE